MLDQMVLTQRLAVYFQESICLDRWEMYDTTVQNQEIVSVDAEKNIILSVKVPYRDLEKQW